MTLPSLTTTTVDTRDDQERSVRATADDLILDHLGLADAIAHRFARRGEEDDDLRQVARTGLVEAAHRFDASRGEFPPFAAATVAGAIKRQFRDHGWLVRPPRGTQELVISMRVAWAELVQSLAAEPTSRQLADRLGVTAEEVRSAHQAGQGYRAAWAGTEHWTGAEGTGSTRAWSEIEARMTVARLLESLGQADRELLYMRFVEERTQDDIAADLQVSQMQVSRLLARVLARLRNLLEEPVTA